MNKRDFYKELMSEYSFDKDKIFANAKKGKLAGQKPLPIYIGMTAAAAAVIVAVSGLSIALNNRSHGGVTYNPNSGPTLMDLTFEERVQKALDELRKNENSSEMRDVLVSFRSPLAPPQAQGILTSGADGSVIVKMLIMEDDSKLTDREAIGAVFNGGTDRIRAAVINCAGYLMSQIDKSEFVELVEIVTNEDLANLTMIEPVTPPAPTPAKPDPVVKPDDGNITGSAGIGGEAPDKPIVGIDDPPVSDPDTDDPAKPEDPVNPGGDEHPGQVTQPEDPTAAGRLPEGVTLPAAAAEKKGYITDDIGAERAYFLTENVFFVKTKNTVRLYKWNGELESLAAEQDAPDARVCWISENGSRLMIISTENGVSSKMFIVDANNCTIHDMHVENIINGSIEEAAYNETLDILALNVKEDGRGSIYTANLSGYQAANETLVASGLNSAALLAAHSGAVYFSSVGEATTIYKYSDGRVVEAMRLDGLCAAITNSAFTHAALAAENGSFIFDPASETLIPVQSDKTISFGVAAHAVACNGGYYKISDGALLASGSLETAAKIDFMRSFSSKHMAVVSNGSVRVIPSVYTEKAKRNGVEFTQPTENAAAEAREAVNAAIGVINVIVDGKGAECGIDTPEKLELVINGCFTKAAAAELNELRGSESDRLVAVTVADTILSMDSENSGTLYVKAGTFDGRTGYLVISVKLASEDGVLKADCLMN